MYRRLGGSIALLLAVAAGSAQAQIIPGGGTFGSLPNATFNGTNSVANPNGVSSGQPNNAVEQNTVDQVTLGLQAQQRYTSPALTNNGDGTYYATPGYSVGGASNAPNADWNFDFFIGGPNSGDFTYKLLYEFDPASGTTRANHGVVTTFGTTLTALGGTYSDSWNLAFPFLDVASSSAFGSVTPPPTGTFDATVPGEYTFELQQINVSGAIVNHIGIQVDVTGTPEPASLALMATGLVGIAGFARRRRA